jgi:hypothetical protein
MSRKNYVAKILGPFDVLKAPISQKHAKTTNLLHIVKTKSRVFRKSPESMKICLGP